ncbi:MAG: excinuclease ABC subunit UvrC [Clostridia bacterium]|nr:excinuclease ABC subunit UvrC [Clostridia bacterium]
MNKSSQPGSEDILKGLLDKARLLPLCPGIYIMHSSDGTVLYVGKSKALKNRVMSYFQNVQRHPAKTLRLVMQIRDFECIFTQSESEALILENELIKLHKPRYNIKLKDDKNYPYVRLSLSEPYPRLTVARQRRSSQDRYFGPYGSASAARAIVDAANTLFLLPNCKKKFPSDIGKERPCLYYHIGRCMGVCLGNIGPAQYRRSVEDAVLFLKDDHKALTESLRTKMKEAADKLDFERAAKLRDSIRTLDNFSSKQQIVRDADFEADVFGLFTDDVSSAVCILKVRGGRLIDSRTFHFSSDEILTPESFHDTVVSLYKTADQIPRRILFDPALFDPEDTVCAEALSAQAQKTVRITAPERGDSRRLVELASENAKEAALHRRAVIDKNTSVLDQLRSLLGLETPPKRIEAIDISNNGDSFISAGIICVVDGKFSKKDYRSFNIESNRRDDVGSMKEAFLRRFGRARDGDEGFLQLPDLILADGGVGQVNAVKSALSEFSLDIPVFGMVKDEFHKTRCLTDGENDISISKNQAVFNFIYKIQEEVHRFAFSRMDTRRLKTVRGSALEKIPGIGAAKAKALLSALKSVKAVSSASVDELKAVKGISSTDAENIRNYFVEKS